ncbi:MAG: DUF1328 domain-containing protein [Rhodanobacteraceae bacterium]
MEHRYAVLLSRFLHHRPNHGFFGFLSVAGLASTVAKILFVVFIMLFIASFTFESGRRGV